MSTTRKDLEAMDFGELRALHDMVAEVMAARRDEAAVNYKAELAALREKYKGVARAPMRRRKKRRARDNGHDNGAADAGLNSAT